MCLMLTLRKKPTIERSNSNQAPLMLFVCTSPTTHCSSDWSIVSCRVWSSAIPDSLSTGSRAKLTRKRRGPVSTTPTRRHISAKTIKERDCLHTSYVPLGNLAFDPPSIPSSLRAAPPRPRCGITSLVSTRIDQLIDAQAAPTDTGFMSRCSRCCSLPGRSPGSRRRHRGNCHTQPAVPLPEAPHLGHRGSETWRERRSWSNAQSVSRAGCPFSVPRASSKQAPSRFRSRLLRPRPTAC